MEKTSVTLYRNHNDLSNMRIGDAVLLNGSVMVYAGPVVHDDGQKDTFLHVNPLDNSHITRYLLNRESIVVHRNGSLGAHHDELSETVCYLPGTELYTQHLGLLEGAAILFPDDVARMKFHTSRELAGAAR